MAEKKMPELRHDEKMEQKLTNHIFNTNRGQYPGILAGVVENAFYFKPLYNQDLFSKLHYGHCTNLELDYYRCASRVGLINVQRGNDCLMEFEDLHECIGSSKALYYGFALPFATFMESTLDQFKSLIQSQYNNHPHAFQSTKRALAMKAEARRQGKPYLEEPVRYTTVRMNNDGCTTTIV